MFTGATTKIVSACIALTAFAVAVLAGVAADNGVDVVLGRALWAMLGGALAGALIGAAAEVAVATTIHQLTLAGETPDEPTTAKTESSAQKKATS